MLKLPDSWVWDFWIADDGTRYHCFFLFASRALLDPDRRHARASVGHAISDDLVSWERVEDALVRSEPGDFDDLATWTGSVVRAPAGHWEMFYTGTTERDGAYRQAVGRATSDDLFTWHKHGEVLAADPTWYETLHTGEWPDEAFRDPWVFWHDGQWHMLITARARDGAALDRGIVGHGVSDDLVTWTCQPPITTPDAGFGQLEVCHTFQLEGQWFIIFNCFGTEIDQTKRSTAGGIWVAPATGPLGPYDLAAAQLLTGPELYVGKVIHDRVTDSDVFLAFHNVDAAGNFGGYVSDPIPISLLDGMPRLG